MNERNKHKVTGQMNHQTADPKVNASEFLFFPTAHFLKTILASRTNGTFGFAQHTSRPFAKPKEPFFANALWLLNDKILYLKSHCHLIFWVNEGFIKILEKLEMPQKKVETAESEKRTTSRSNNLTISV